MTDVVIIGAGPAGLTLASELALNGVRDVTVLDRDDESGGVPRHSHHPGYGLRDLHRSLSGPEYARRLTERAAVGADLRTRATVTAVHRRDGDLAVDVTAPDGRTTIPATAVVLATGCRERPRAARLVPGSRPAGVLTTGWLQRMVHSEGQRPGSRAVVVGAEHVSYSAVMTLAGAGCETVAMVTGNPTHTSFRGFDLGARLRYRFPLLTRSRVTDIMGTTRVTAVEVTDLDSGTRRMILCDTVVFTGDWVAENELARRLGLGMTASSGPGVDQRFRTSATGVFAVGNLLHPASTADVCALDGRSAARPIVDWLSGTGPAWGAGVRVEVDDPLLWSAPSVVTGGEPGGRMLLQTGRPLHRPAISITQSDRTLWSGRVPWAMPTRPFPVPGGWRSAVDPRGPVVRVSVT